MKTRTWIILFTLLLILCAGASLPLLLPGDAATHAEILSNGQLLHTVDLRINQQLDIPAPNGGSNTVTIADGRIAVTQATCPDHYCMHRGYCNSGAQIVCLPNRLVIRFVEETEIDAIVG